MQNYLRKGSTHPYAIGFSSKTDVTSILNQVMYTMSSYPRIQPSTNQKYYKKSYLVADMNYAISSMMVATLLNIYTLFLVIIS